MEFHQADREMYEMKERERERAAELRALRRVLRIAETVQRMGLVDDEDKRAILTFENFIERSYHDQE
jgi:hypothetical protein